MSTETKLATFAGGCFWCMVGPFEELDGVHSITSGYTGGHTENPTYEEVCSDTTGHVEAVQMEYDPQKTSYDTLLRTFWRQIDPTDNGGQFNDRGESYQTAVFYHDEEQKQKAEQSRKELDENGPFQSPVVTPVLPASTFYKAEEHHQDYHHKNKMHYQLYKRGSGRAGFIQTYWGDQ
ncbi:peptide-methionine (S)-S-oxide reductase MsrA [Salibacterium halotolerans]|uniref:Peptide methionine sulfoxide reductase MsrA n=1 Tax=Salibacterium halotolerans TaxID=1884432 RepID=A0A1I5RHX2_9BACI|nr:peptide-methionine (S)-S-oxide reductase MsrA [Salibacterium halotolerans]SFP57970.1 peptide methionine sulfoxide reductase msrA/msrB [Salibacterium halotolerans]